MPQVAARAPGLPIGSTAAVIRTLRLSPALELVQIIVKHQNFFVGSRAARYPESRMSTGLRRFAQTLDPSPPPPSRALGATTQQRPISALWLSPSTPHNQKQHDDCEDHDDDGG